MNTSASTSVVCPILVGRAPQLAAIEELIARIDASQAAPRVLLIDGEAGMGKSRLLAELKERAARGGWGVVQGSCFEPDQALPYAPVLDLLHMFFGARALATSWRMPWGRRPPAWAYCCPRWACRAPVGRRQCSIQSSSSTACSIP